MAQATATTSLGERLHWNDFIKPWLVRLIFIALGVLVGLYILAPRQTRAADSYLPNTFTDIPTGIVQLTNPEGVNVLLPVRIADTTAARSNGFKDVGPVALANTFLLYGQSRETTRPTTYNFQNVRAPLELAIINDAGQVVALQEAPLGSERLSVAENHRWVLAAKAGTLAAYGIAVGSMLDPESIQKINL